MSAALMLKNIPNLSLYYSTDSDNVDNAYHQFYVRMISYEILNK